MPKVTIKDDHHNLKLNCLHEFSWGFGIAFHTLYAIIPLFLKQLGAPQGISLSVAGLWSILVAFPQLCLGILLYVLHILWSWYRYNYSHMDRIFTSYIFQEKTRCIFRYFFRME